MFAEELASNSGRKRAEQNRVRRQRLKAEQKRAAEIAAVAKPAADDAVAVVGAATALVAPDNRDTTTTLASSSNSTTTLRHSSTSTSTSTSTTATAITATTKQVAAARSHALSAVEKAQQQRQIRANAALQLKAIIHIQAWYRSIHGRLEFLIQQTDLLTKRLQDITTLRTLLATSTKQLDYYIPPPATTTTLVQQLLFIVRHHHVHRRGNNQDAISYSRRRYSLSSSRTNDHVLLAVVLLAQVLHQALLPAMVSADENVNPLLVWMESVAGRQRLQHLLRFTLMAAITKGIDREPLLTIITFLQLVVGVNQAVVTTTTTAAAANTVKSAAPDMVVQFARSRLLPATVEHWQPDPALFVMTTTNVPSLGLIAAVRYFFLFVVAGPSPIPPNAVNVRDQCITTAAKEQASELLRLVVHAAAASSTVTERQHLHAMIVTSLFTAPLLTWKISGSVLTYLITPLSSSSFAAATTTTTTTSVPFVDILHSFGTVHASTFVGRGAGGGLEELLASTDIGLKACPATATQCLLANLVQLGRLCPAVNGTNATNQIDFGSATLYFNMIAAVLTVVPLGTFITSRESAVEWMNDGSGHRKAVVLSPVILEQCRSLLVDSFVRNLFYMAINTTALDTDRVLATKEEKDLVHENDLLQVGSSAAALAAKDARIDRSKMFWNSSNWARKLTNGVSNLLSADGSKGGSKASVKDSNRARGGLLNTSSVSREMAQGQRRAPSLEDNNNSASFAALKTPKGYTADLLVALTRAYSVVLARWGGGGGLDIVLNNNQRDRSQWATLSPEPCTLALLNTLCFGSPLVKVLWSQIQSDTFTINDVYGIIDPNKGKIPVRSLQITPRWTTSKNNHDGAALLFMFVSLLAHVLIVTDDIEIHDMDRPLPVHQIRRCIQVLKKLLYRACCIDDTGTNIDSNFFGLALIAASSRALRDLYDRSSRRPLCVPKLWIVSDLIEKDIKRCKTHGDYVSLLSFPVLRVCPFLVSFQRRLKIFERIVTTSRIDNQGVNDANPFNSNPLRPGIPIRITRGRILEDGLATMNNLGRNMRQRLSVQYYNEAGVRETGIDVGGLFKEFWTDLCAIAFDPNYALFRVTDGAGNCMYPNPSSGAAHGPDHIMLFEFLGRILGKALYEGITIHPRFAHFFLSFLRGDYNYLHMLPDLSTVDPQLYNNLMFLKTYEGDASDLCLTFTITNDDFGGTTEVPLVPNGSNLEVTNENKHRYVGLVAKYYVVDRVKEQSEAFTRGLWEVIDQSWLYIFNEPELQVLISGASDGKLDVEDMKAHTRYIGGFTGLDRTVSRFWNVVARFDSKEQAELLRFVTSCERPPPLGFASMNPPFTIQRVGIMRDSDKLPTASTCFNTLKLPTYSSEKVLKERLLYAIQSGAGFELS